MEALDPRLTTDLAKVGITVLAHLAILSNRKIIRPRLNSDIYNRVSLQAEHIVHQATFAMYCDSVLDTILISLKFPHNILTTYLGIAFSMIDALDQDARKHQWDQFTSDIVGCVAYGVTSLSG